MSERASWQVQRDEDAEQQSEDAYALLVDKTIVHAQVMPHGDGCDCLPRLRLTLSDGTVVDIEGGYGGYTGHSCDEYPMLVSVARMP
jgi:hypothetical protein